MSDLAGSAPVAAPGDWLLVAAIVVPAGGAVAAALLGARWTRIAVPALVLAGLSIAIAIVAAVYERGAPLQYVLGAWRPPLGLGLRADGLSAVMLLTAAVVIAATAAFAFAADRASGGAADRGARRSFSYWVLLLGTWGGLNTVFLANDLFTLFVAMELLTFSAVPLVCLSGTAQTMAAALRYLLFALLGSLLYLLGTGVLYGLYGTLDFALLAGRVDGSPVAIGAIAVMTAGLLAKAALVPMHMWLPPAHAGAAPAASAVLSALVVKAPFFVALRLWVDAAPGLLPGPAAQLVAALGAAAILLGSILALVQKRLKLLVAYSTVAQIGYLFLIFALVARRDDAAALGVAVSSTVLTAAVLQVASHALAKASMFMVAGLFAEAAGHDRLDGLAGVGRVVPAGPLAMVIAGASLLGVPPSGGFWAKWIMLDAAIESGQWWWALIIVVGSILAGGYLYRAVAPSLAAGPAAPMRSVSGPRQAVALGLALAALLMGLLAVTPARLVEIGRTPATTTPIVSAPIASTPIVSRPIASTGGVP